MRELIEAHLDTALCLIILLSRLGDIGSTWLVTPTLRLESNVIVRKLGWPFAWLTLLVCLVPYYSAPLGVVILVPSLLVTASNISKFWLVRAVGEEEYAEFVRRAVLRGRLWHGLFGIFVASFALGLAAAVLWFLAPDPDRDWGYWFSMGIALYAFAILLHGSISTIAMFRRVRRSRNDLTPFDGH